MIKYKSFVTTTSFIGLVISTWLIVIIAGTVTLRVIFQKHLVVGAFDSVGAIGIFFTHPDTIFTDTIKITIDNIMYNERNRVIASSLYYF